MPYPQNSGARLNRVLSEQSTLLRLALALLAAVGALYIGEHIYLGEYLTTDENSYMFQAWIFLQGKFSLSCPPLEDAFFHRMIICDDQAGWVSRYPPAHSIWLMPGIALEFPRLMTAVAASLSVWFISGAGEKLAIPAWCTGLLLMISPYFWLMQGSVLSHTSGLATTAILVWAYLAWFQERKLAFAAIAGLAWAFLFLNRSYTAVWIAIPLSVHALLCLYQSLGRIDFKRIFAGTIVFAACSSVGIVMYICYNHTITGNALTSTFLYYDPSEGPGFGSVHGREHTPATGGSFLKNNLTALNVNLWGFTGSLFAWLALSLIGWRKMITPLFLSATFLVWVSYSAFWFPGILEVQPIYYYETLPFVILTAAMGLKRLFEAPWCLPSWSKLLVVSLMIFGTASIAFKTFQINAQVVTKRNAYTHAFQGVIRNVPTDSIVVLEGLHKDILAQNSWNPYGLDSKPLILRNVHGVTQVIPALFPGRPVFKISGWTPKAAEPMAGPESKIRTIHASRMLHATGERNKLSTTHTLIAQAGQHKEGLLAYSARQYLIPGSYEATFYLNARGNPGEIIGHVEFIDVETKTALGQHDVFAGDKTVVLKLDVDTIGLAEPRVVYRGKGSLEFGRIELHLISTEILDPL